MSKTKSFRINYKVESESLENIISLVFELTGNTGMEPETITLPSGTKIPWYSAVAREFAAKGRLTEKQFIKLSMEKE